MRPGGLHADAKPLPCLRSPVESERMPTFNLRALIAKGDGQHSSRRTVEEVLRIFQEVNEIWQQAGVAFRPRVLEWAFDQAALDEIVRAASERRGDVDALIGLTGDRPREITALYVRSIGGSSGKVFRPKKTILVVDDTKVSDSRTTAHELGHLFGLEHWVDRPPPEEPDRPPSHLMARTQPGVSLTPRDIQQVQASLPACGLAFSG